MSGFATPTKTDIERLQRQIDSLSLVIEGLEQRVAELDGGYSCSTTASVGIQHTTQEEQP